MASQTGPEPGTTRSSDLGRSIRKASLAAAVIAAVNKAGLNNALASAAVAIAAPAAATAFVYEVSTLRSAQLQHEATDRVEFRRIATEVSASPSEGAPTSAIAAPPRLDVGGKLDGMIASRIRLLDIFGDEPSTVAPIYARIIKQMLNDDNAILASLADKPDDASGPDALATKAARLRVVHARLMHLVGA